MNKILTLLFTFLTAFTNAQNSIVVNNFSNSNDWTIGLANLQGQWQVQAITPSDVTTYMGDMASTTASNGFAVFNAIQYLINGPVNDQDATLELNNTIDLTNYPAVLIEFEQRYKKYNYDETFLEFSTDNGNTWPSSLAIQLNTQAVTNNPAVQELVAINITSYVGGQSSVRVRFRWKSISSASANPNGFGSGYGWMVDDLKVTVPNSNDLQNLSSWIFGENSNGAEYGRTPIAQVEANYYVGASVYNFGSTAQSNVVVSGDFNGPTNFSTTASIASILTDSTKRIESLLPLNFGVGVYNGTFTVTSDSDQVGGPNFGDNIQLRNFEITNDVYSLDGIGNHPVGTEILGSIGTTSFTGAEDGLICATMFPFYANDTINSVKVLIDTSNSSAGAEVILRIIDSTSFRDQLFNNAIFTSNLYVVTASDIAQGFIEIPVGTQASSGFQSLPIQAGSYYTALEMYSLGNTYDIAIIDDKTVGQPDWSSAIFIPNDQNYTNGTAFAIRVNLNNNSNPVNPASCNGQIWSDDFSSPSNWILDNSCSYTAYNITGGYDFVNGTSPTLSTCIGTGTNAIDPNTGNTAQWFFENNNPTMPWDANSTFSSSSALNGFLFISSDATGGSDQDGTPIFVTATTAGPIDLSGESNVRLFFQHNYRWWQETRGVRVSGDNGNTWHQYEFTNSSGHVNQQSSGNPEITTIDISNVAGGQSQVVIQFYYEDNDYWAWGWAVDDVEIKCIPNIDIAGVSISNSPVLALNNAPFTISGQLNNRGISTVSSMDLNYSIDGGPLVTQSLTNLNFVAGDNYSFNHSTTWNPSSTGNYNIEIWASNINGSNDMDLSNDRVSKTISVASNVAIRRPMLESFTSSTNGPCFPGNQNVDTILQGYQNNQYSILKYQVDFPGA